MTCLTHSRFITSSFRILCVLSLLLSQTGCATVFQGGMQEVKVTSNPPGSDVYVNGKMVSKTPTEIVLLNRKQHQVLRLEKEGYTPIKIEMKRKLSAWSLGGILVGTAFSFLNFVSIAPVIALDILRSSSHNESQNR